MRRSLLLLLWSSLLFSATAAMSEAAPGWLEGGIFPETETPETTAEAPSWGAWFLNDDAWLREAVNPVLDPAQRYFSDVNGNWYVFDGSAGDLPVPGVPPQWYPWEDTPEKRGLAPKGNDENIEIDKNRSFSWGEWEEHFGVWFRRITPPGQPLMGQPTLWMKMVHATSLWYIREPHQGSWKGSHGSPGSHPGGGSNPAPLCLCTRGRNKPPFFKIQYGRESAK